MKIKRRKSNSFWVLVDGQTEVPISLEPLLGQAKALSKDIRYRRFCTILSLFLRFGEWWEQFRASPSA